MQQPIIIESILGSQFNVQAIEELDFGRHKAITPQVTGDAYVCGKAQWLINQQDPLKNGFLLR